MDYAELIAFAQELAAAARAETVDRWASGCTAKNKGRDIFDPVTEADREAELAMRELIRERYPDHGITGEEWPDEPGSSAYCWSLDPIDGTRSFLCRLPTWVTLIGLLRDHQPFLGLIDAPCLEETYVAAGDEAWLSWKGQRTRIATSRCTEIPEARLSTTDPGMFEGAYATAFDALRRQAKTVRYGHDGYAYARLAAGSIDLVVETGLKPYDYQALIPLIRGAGGVIGNWRGEPDLTGGDVIAAATLELFDRAVAVLKI